MTIQRPILRWHGGKWVLASWIISHFPARYRNYIEPFGGAASVLLKKPRSSVEVYNDLDDEIISFFKTLRDDQLCCKLVRACYLTPFGRREFDLAYEKTDDMVERARRLIVRCSHGFGSHSHNIENCNGFRTNDTKGHKSYAREFCGLPDIILQVADRFKGVTIETRKALELIPMYDAADSLFYCDPPYVMGLRKCNGKGYSHEMSNHDHRQLAWVLKQVKGKVVLSGYPCHLYDTELYPSWRRVEKKSSAGGQRGRTPRTEVLWLNF